MDTYIVRQPILDSQRKVAAYEILYKEDVTSLYTERTTNFGVATAIEQFLTNMDGDRFLDGKTAFFTFTPSLLMKNIPKMFPPEKMVIQIDDNTIIHPVAQKIVYRFKKQGYHIAVQGFTFAPRYLGILDVVDMIKVDFKAQDASLENVVRVAHSFNKQVAAYNISSAEALERAQALGCDYYQGSYVAEQKTHKVHRTDHLQSNFFQLMLAVTADEPDTDEIAAIISRDVTLSFSLIKLVNSAYFARRNRVKSVQQALVILGIGQLKQWIYLLSFKQDNGGVQDELIKISFQRGKFCEALVKFAPSVNLSPSEAYMLGMFSTLGTLMEVPLEQALSELPISEDIKLALTTGEGAAGHLFNVVTCYENADWAGMNQSAETLGIPNDVIARTYFECIEAVNEIWKGLQEPFAEQGG